MYLAAENYIPYVFADIGNNVCLLKKPRSASVLVLNIRSTEPKQTDEEKFQLEGIDLEEMEQPI